MRELNADTEEDSGSIDHTDPETLRRLYWGEQKSLADIAELANRTTNPIRYQMEKHGIPRRSDGEGGRLKNDTGHPSIFISNGYWWATSTHKGKKDRVKLSRLLATLKVDDLSELNGVVVHHKNELKRCDYLDNIEVKTPEKHMSGHSKGSKHHNSTLTEGDVVEIKHLLQNSGLTQSEIGNKFGVDQTVISKIKLGKSWSHVSIED